MTEKIPERTPEKAHGKVAEFKKFIWDIIWDFKTTLKLRLEKDYDNAKSFPVFLCCVVILTALVTYMLISHLDNNALQQVRHDYERTNSFISGQLSNSIVESDKAKVICDGQITDYITTIANLKADHNTVLQEKNSDIARLTEERDAAQIRISQLQSLPDTAFQVYSNANMLTKMERYDLACELIVNGLNITNYLINTNYFIPFDTNRTFTFRASSLPNDAKNIDRLTLRFSSPIDVTNYTTGLVDGGWQLMLGSQGLYGGQGCELETIANYTVTSANGWESAPLTVSTNYTYTYFNAGVTIFAPGFNGVLYYSLIFAPPELINKIKSQIIEKGVTLRSKE
jgi:hypothetical protein